MSEPLMLVLGWLAGVALGVLFFGGLWWTVRKGISSPRPVLWFFGSLLMRTGITMVGFYFVSGNHWERLGLCLVGFVMARLVITRLTRPAASRLIQPQWEASHATQSR